MGKKTRLILSSWKQKGCLFENFPAQSGIKNITYINLTSLLPNTTSVLQPMEQGVIRSLKAHYRKNVTRLCIKAVEINRTLLKINILQPMKHLTLSWKVVSKETIISCFKKSYIRQSTQQTAVNNGDNPFESLQEGLPKFHDLDNDAVQPNLSA